MAWQINQSPRGRNTPRLTLGLDSSKSLSVTAVTKLPNIAAYDKNGPVRSPSFITIHTNKANARGLSSFIIVWLYMVDFGGALDPQA